MRYIVSTVKDSLANVTRFVEGNLRAGADFLFVFSEDATDEVSDFLSDHELVMHVPSGPDGGHWGDERPANIYLRQNTNANLVRTLLAACPWATWLFHLDGDEVLDIDTSELESLSPDVRAVRLSPLESVAAMTNDWDGYFKYPLSESELALLYTLGAIPEPKLRALYNGHVAGKVGIRPSLELRIGIHGARVGDDKIPMQPSEGLRMLHYDSFNADEFVRKWMAKIVNEGVQQRANRLTIRSAVEAATRLSHVPAQRRAEILREIFERHVADDVDLLSELGFLTRIDESRHQYEPRHHSPEQLAAMSELLMLLKEEDLEIYRPIHALDEQRQALDKALARASASTAGLARTHRPDLDQDGARPDLAQDGAWPEPEQDGAADENGVPPTRDDASPRPNVPATAPDHGTRRRTGERQDHPARKRPDNNQNRSTTRRDEFSR